jgi:hypothetical protein
MNGSPKTSAAQASDPATARIVLNETKIRPHDFIWRKNKHHFSTHKRRFPNVRKPAVDNKPTNKQKQRRINGPKLAIPKGYRLADLYRDKIVISPKGQPVVVNRPMAEAVARFIVENTKRGERINPLVALTRISGAFPCIALDVALAGLIFRELLAERRRLQ